MLRYKETNLDTLYAKSMQARPLSYTPKSANPPNPLLIADQHLIPIHHRPHVLDQKFITKWIIGRHGNNTLGSGAGHPERGENVAGEHTVPGALQGFPHA